MDWRGRRRGSSIWPSLVSVIRLQAWLLSAALRRINTLTESHCASTAMLTSSGDTRSREACRTSRVLDHFKRAVKWLNRLQSALSGLSQLLSLTHGVCAVIKEARVF